MSEVKRTEEEITREGNPRKPQGEEGKVSAVTDEPQSLRGYRMGTCSLEDQR